jgi:Spinocerebellar ataxia type 10 protein domain
MASDPEGDLSHSSSSCCDWNVLLKELRQLKRKNINSPSPSRINFEQHFLRHRSVIPEQLDRQEDMDRLETVLRVALCYVSFPSSLSSIDCIEWRRTIQTQAFDAWHVTLLLLILDKDNVLAKCRQIAAQVLCNTITDCAETSARLMRSVTPAPSPSTITQKILSEKTQNATDSGTADISSATNWVDLMLASASHRSTLAVVVASLHNCLCALSPSDLTKELVLPIGDSTLLISTLLRHVISSAAVLPSRAEDQNSTDNGCDAADDATEWIALLLSKFCRLGRLPHVYRSIRPGTLSHDVLPEHVVLLHLVRSMIEESPHHGSNRCFMLGGEVDGNDGHCIVETHRFLSSLYLALRDAAYLSSDSGDLQRSSIQLVLDILAESLAEDSFAASTCRCIIGTETLLLPALVSDLAEILDAWYATNKAIYTRHQTKLNETDQCRITASVRVLGNLCYHCMHNQDLLRETVVPYSNPSSETHNVERTEGASPTTPMDRNGLHVLLSTTSMSYACFTLREWAVVAIRAALEECPQSQAVVAELEAQSSVNSADLEHMGIRVNLDTAKGVVSVSQAND